MNKIVFAILTTALCASSFSDDYFMTVKTKTDDRENAGTNALAISIELNRDQSLRYTLDNPNLNDFEFDALDEFPRIPIKIDPKQIEKATLLVSGGNDAWYCDCIYLTFHSGDQSSEEIKLKVGKWLSADATEGNSSKTLNLKKKIRF
jgi:hypothetical protein